MSSLPPTVEQAAILNAAISYPTANFVVEALAGTGKTTTIVDHLLPKLTGSSLLLAYNKSIEMEIKRRVPVMLALSTTIGTVHSFGLGQYRRAHPKIKVEGGKLHFLFRNILDSKPSFRRRFNERFAGRAGIVSLTSHAKNAGFGLASCPAIDDEDAWFDLIEHFSLDDDFHDAGISLPDAVEMASYLLFESNKATTTLDFEDMIYLPLLFNLPITQFNHVIIDEAQDISYTRFELARRACAERGRMIAVGDRHQAIYGFTGADAGALDNIITTMNAATLPLTICWRCDEAIISEAQNFVPTIRARPNASPGSVSSTSIHNLFSTPIPLGSAILCRLNRPNIAVALEILRAGQPCKIEGRDLGRTLLEHIKKAEPLYATTDIWALLSRLEDYRERRTGELIAKNKPTAAAYLEDEVAAAMLLTERAAETGGTGTGYSAIEALINTLFADNIPSKNTITLSSVHKAKGREWPTVYLLGREDYMPFHMAKQPWEVDQEHNLIYVAVTRAEKALILVDNVKDWLDSRR